jgi:hypothetical protein
LTALDTVATEMFFFFASAVILSFGSLSITAMERRLQIAIGRTAEWCTKNGFTFSQTKTVAVRFYRGKNRHDDLRLLLYGQLITPKESTRYLGMIFDNRLEWNHHIASVKEDCMKKSNILKNISRKTWGSDRITLLRLYRTLIIPKLDYGCEAYASARDWTLAKLDPVHNCAIRLCTGAFKSSPVVSLYTESGEPPLKTRREKLLVRYLLRTKQLPQSPANECMMKCFEQGNAIGALLPVGERAGQLLHEIGLDNVDVMPHVVPTVPI